jgi:hypothetical protein
MASFGLSGIRSSLWPFIRHATQDPLNLLPLLISSDKDASLELIQAISHQGNAKEAIIAVQEALERLQKIVSSETEEGEESDQRYASDLVQLLRICESGMLCSFLLP